MADSWLRKEAKRLIRKEAGSLAIEELARAFAERALRGISTVRLTQVVDRRGQLWAAEALLPQADNLFGLGFATKAETEAWLAKSIAEAVAAAEKE